MFKFLKMSLIFLFLPLNLLFFFKKKIVFLEWELMKFFNLNWSITFMGDKYSFFFSFLVSLISLSIYYYSLEYMKEEKENSLFFLILFLFFSSMQILIFSFSFSSILLGWDGLGITSFYLIVFYHNIKSLAGGLTTVMTNRLGDCFMIIVICMAVDFLTWNKEGLNEFSKIFSLIFLLGLITKSAQFPFSFWLPKAMAAPTPVSSLVHSSTLVTAGVYIVFRFNHLFNFLSMNMLKSFSLFTLCLGSLMALNSFDCKEIIAFSTLSHMGFLMLILSMKLKDLAFFHLSIHAMFKSVLFMCGGFLIHNFNSQDIRMIGLKNLSLILILPFMITLISMSGLPFLSGFYSKDYLIESLSLNNNSLSFTLLILIIVSSSVLYSFRLIFVMFDSVNKFSYLVNKWKLSEMLKSILFMIFGSICLGSMTQWMFINKTSLHTMKMKMLIIFTLIFGIFFSFLINKMKIFSFSILKSLNLNYMKFLKWFPFTFFLFDQGWLKMFFFIFFIDKSSIFFSNLWIKFIFFCFVFYYIFLF